MGIGYMEGLCVVGLEVEIYAQAAEKMFAKTGGTGIGYVITWSWWAFLVVGDFFFIENAILPLQSFLFFPFCR